MSAHSKSQPGWLVSFRQPLEDRVEQNHGRAHHDGQRVYYGIKDQLAVKLCELVRAQVAGQ